MRPKRNRYFYFILYKEQSSSLKKLDILLKADETKVNAMRFSPPGLFGDDDEDEENDLFK